MIKDLIYDVGMHDGNDTAYYLHKGYRVVAIEANPDLVEVARGRFQQEIRDGRVQILRVGIAEKEGRSKFWVNDEKSDWSSFDRTIPSREGYATRSIDVECRRFQTILAEHGVPYYLKIDIEGNDRCCLAGLSPDDLPVYVSIEFSELDVITELRALGYTEFKCIDQASFCPVTRPPSLNYMLYYRLLWLVQVLSSRRSGLTKRLAGRLFWGLEQRLRSDGDWRFSAGCSGRFGEDTLGSWRDAEKVGRWVMAYCRKRESGGRKLAHWYDIHARRAS